MKPIEEMTYEEFAAEFSKYSAMSAKAVDFLNSDPRFQEFMEWARSKAISSGFTADDWQAFKQDMFSHIMLRMLLDHDDMRKEFSDELAGHLWKEFHEEQA